MDRVGAIPLRSRAEKRLKFGAPPPRGLLCAPRHIRAATEAHLRLRAPGRHLRRGGLPAPRFWSTSTPGPPHGAPHLRPRPPSAWLPSDPSRAPPRRARPPPASGPLTATAPTSGSPRPPSPPARSPPSALQHLAATAPALGSPRPSSPPARLNLMHLGFLYLGNLCYVWIGRMVFRVIWMELIIPLKAETLQDFAGGSFEDQDQAGESRNYENYYFPPSLHRLSFLYMGTNEMQLLFPYGASLKKLDLQFTFLTTEDHCQLVQRCPNLEVLEVRDVIGDRGLEVVAQTCKKLQRLRVERGDDDQGGLEDEQGRITQVGLMAVAQGCPDLEYWAVHVSDITNAALEAIGTFSRNINDFRLVLLDREVNKTDLPLDNGVRALLRGCTKLRRFAFYVRPGALSDVGLGYVGEFSKTIRYMLLGNVGESDLGLLQFSRGCPSLQKLELRSCCFSERALAIAALQLKSLRYLWVQGYKASPTGTDLMAMARPFWNIEFIAPKQDEGPEGQAQILAYYSLAGMRTDCPQSVIPIYPSV